MSEEIKTEVNNETGESVHVADPATAEVPQYTTGQLKQFKKQQKQYMKMLASFKARQELTKRKKKAFLERIKRDIGKDNFKVLKELVTKITPAVVDETGKVTQQERRQINYTALLQESKFLKALMREEKMKSGKRKRTTGTSSQRAAHNSTIRFLKQRDVQALKEPIVKHIDASVKK